MINFVNCDFFLRYLVFCLSECTNWRFDESDFKSFFRVRGPYLKNCTLQWDWKRLEEDTFLWSCLSLYSPVYLWGRASARKVRSRLSYIRSTPTFYISIFNTTLFVKSQLKGSLKIHLHSIQCSVEILVNGRLGEIIKSTTVLVGPVEYVKCNSIDHIFKFIVRLSLNTFEASP